MASAIAAASATTILDWSARPGGILVYGATGLTGKLISQRIKELGLPATLAGRSPAKLEALRERLGLPVEAVELSDGPRLEELVARHKVVLHVAGPFSETSEPMVRACLRSRTHYLDVTGEFGVMEGMREAHGADAEKSGVMLLPACGFDIVPGDSVSDYLKQKLPSATHLHIASFIQVKPDTKADPPRVSVGTLLSAVFYAITYGGTIVKDGQLVKEGIGKRHKSMKVPSGKEVNVISFPSAELHGAWVSTKIPNIVGYVAAPKVPFLPLFFTLITFLVTTWPFKPLIRSLITRVQPAETVPDVEPGKGVFAAGEAVDAATGQSVRAAAGVTEGYKFTAVSSVEIARRVLEGDFKPGFQVLPGLDVKLPRGRVLSRSLKVGATSSQSESDCQIV